MKKLLLLSTYCILFTQYTFSQTYTWATTDNTYQNSIGKALAMDASGNLFAAETYSNTSMRSGVNIIKYDVNHNVIWKQKIEGKYFSSYFSLATDVLGNVFYAGSFSDSLFINGTFTTYNGDQNMLLVKFNSLGILQFIKQSIGSVAFGLRVSTDALNNIYVGGIVNGTANFDGTVINCPVIYNYIAKYNSNGVIQWVKNGTGNSFAGWGIGMKTDASNNTYLAGTFIGTVNFGGLSITCNGGNPNSTQNVYLAKIDASGNWLWARNAGGNNQDAIYDLALDNSGNPHITGFIGSTTATFGTFTLTNGGADDYFVAKYDANGNAVWAVNGGGPGSQIGTSICVDNQGTTYIASNSVYFLKFNNTGVYLGADNKSASNNNMVADNNGCIYFTGDIGGSVNFGTTTLNPVNPQQMYIAKYCSPAAGIQQEQEEDNSFSAYPNPTTGKLVISCSSNTQRNTCVLSVKNALGQVIYNETIKDITGSFTKQVDLSTAPKGIYFVELQNNWNEPSQKQNIREVKKIVLQ